MSTNEIIAKQNNPVLRRPVVPTATTELNQPALKKKSARKFKTNWIKVALMAGLIIGLLAIAGYYYQKFQTVKKNPQILAQQETDFLVHKVNRLMKLPADEAPTVATVLDKEKLKDQPFFTESQNGDKLLVFTKAQKAILYRVSEDRIINVGPIVLNGSNTPEAQTSDKNE